MDNINKYSKIISSIANRIAEEEKENIRKASLILADVIIKDRLINVFGPGSHSHMFVDEMFFRAGGLVPIRPWLNPAIASSENINKVNPLVINCSAIFLFKRVAFVCKDIIGIPAL